jgi:hypothetical protein
VAKESQTGLTRTLLTLSLVVNLGLGFGYLAVRDDLRGSEASASNVQVSALEANKEVDSLRDEVSRLHDEISKQEASNEDITAELKRTQKKLRSSRSDTAGLSATVEKVNCIWTGYKCNAAHVRVTFLNESSRAGAVSCAFEVELVDGSSVYFSGQSDYVPANGEAAAVVSWYGEKGLAELDYVWDSDACERWNDI